MARLNWANTRRYEYGAEQAFPRESKYARKMRKWLDITPPSRIPLGPNPIPVTCYDSAGNKIWWEGCGRPKPW